MKLGSKVLLSLYRQNTFPHWAKSGKMICFVPLTAVWNQTAVWCGICEKRRRRAVTIWR